METINYTDVKTPFGNMALAKSDKGLCRIYFPEDAPFEKALKHDYPDSDIQHNELQFNREKKQIQEYFNGTRQSFDMNLDLRCPPFYKKALKNVAKIPFGKTATYQEIAQRSNNPKAVRAVGSANANNPIPIVIPCHRVLNTGGNLGGYGGKLERKAFLLELEGVL